MTTIEAVNQEISDIQTKLVLANQKADVFIAFIHTLQAGGPVTQEQLDAAGTALATIIDQETALNSKLDAAVVTP